MAAANREKNPCEEQSPAEHIESLITISKDVPRLLQSAGAAIALLAPSTPRSDGDAAGCKQSLAGRKTAFLANVRDYYTTLTRVQASLMAEVTALEKAGIIPKEASNTADEDGLINGGLGSFDVAWLNSRTRDVGLDKERELIDEAKAWLARCKSDDVKMH